MHAEESDALVFLPEDPPRVASARAEPWLVLIVDDDPEVHGVTQMVLRHFTFLDRPLRFMSAFTAAQAQQMLLYAGGVAVCLLDVVMETDTAGLDLVHWIRHDLGNHDLRIVLRTGQPGHAPEQHVILRYDINDYKSKTELTQPKLVSTMTGALRSFRQVQELQASRRKLAEMNRSLEERVAARLAAHRQTEERLQSILDANVYPVVITRQGDALVRYANRRVADLFHLPLEDVVGRHGADYFADPQQREGILAHIRDHGRFDDVEVRLKRADGGIFWALMSGTAMEYEGEACILTSFNDITERKHMQLELERLATTDSLTGCVNRRQFLDRGAQEVARARRFGQALSLLMFDLDHFKAVNDRHGHAAGDAVLSAVAANVRQELREVDTFARLGGEEFAVLLPEALLSDAKQVAERLRRAVAEADHGVEGLGAVTTSVGVAQLTSDDAGVEDLLHHVDAALYDAKRGGRDRVRVAERRA